MNSQSTQAAGQYVNERIGVPPAFEALFSHFYVAKNNTHQSIRKTLLPSFQMILLFSFGKKVTITSGQNSSFDTDSCILLGPIKEPFDYVLPVGADIVVANFQRDAFYRFFGQAISLAQLPTHPDALLEKNCFTDLWSTLKDSQSSTEKIALILDCCKPYVDDHQDAIFQQLVDLAEAHTVLSSIRVVAEKTGQSERNIQLKHKKYLGYSAKEYSRYQRFSRAVVSTEKHLATAQAVDWLEIVSTCGYYDQSQLIHDFQYYLQLSPTQFLKAQSDICIARPE